MCVLWHADSNVQQVRVLGTLDGFAGGPSVGASAVV